MYSPTQLDAQLKAQASFLNNFIQCNPETGQCAITLKGAAFACAVSPSTLKYALTNPAHTLATRLNNLGFSAPSSLLANSYLPDEVFFYALGYFAQESTCKIRSRKKAYALYVLVKEIGARSWMQKLVGHNATQDLTQQVINPSSAPCLITPAAQTHQSQQQQDNEALITAIGTMAQELVKCRTRINNIEAYLRINKLTQLNKTEPKQDSQVNTKQQQANTRPYAQTYQAALQAFNSVKDSSKNTHYKLNAQLANLIKGYSEDKGLPALLIWENLASEYKARYAADILHLAKVVNSMTLQDYVANHPVFVKGLLQIALDILMY